MKADRVVVCGSASQQADLAACAQLMRETYPAAEVLWPEASERPAAELDRDWLAAIPTAYRVVFVLKRDGSLGAQTVRELICAHGNGRWVSFYVPQEADPALPGEGPCARCGIPALGAPAVQLSVCQGCEAEMAAPAALASALTMAQARVDGWNAQHPPGTQVRYWPIRGRREHHDGATTVSTPHWWGVEGWGTAHLLRGGNPDRARWTACGRDLAGKTLHPIPNHDRCGQCTNRGEVSRG